MLTTSRFLPVSYRCNDAGRKSARRTKNMRTQLTLCCSLLCHARVAFALQAAPIAATPRERTIALKAMLDGTSWRLTVDVGRERGTWMPKGWAASGASLTLPIEVTFTDEILPGDGSFFDPAREQHPAVDEIGVSACKRMRASAGIFAGTEGVVVVNITAGAWATWPTGRCGEHRVRFYLDFPDGAQLKDVSIPAGRVYFDTARALVQKWRRPSHHCLPLGPPVGRRRRCSISSVSRRRRAGMGRSSVTRRPSRARPRTGSRRCSARLTSRIPRHRLATMAASWSEPRS